MNTSSNQISWSIKRLYQKAESIHNKIINQRQQKPTTKKIYPQELIMELLSKPTFFREKADIKILSEYLSGKYDYFKKLRDAGEIAKLNRLVSVLNLEIFNENEPIIRFGEEGDKFYILLEGRVNIYKTVYPQKTLTIQEYLELLNKILNEEKNELKYERILEKNKYLKLDMEFLMSIPPASFKNKNQLTLFVEEEEKLCDYGDGFAFGEIALLKKTKRNATIKAQTKSKLVSIIKTDYNKIIKELEEKRLEGELNLFKQNYTIFKNWSLNRLIKLFNCFSRETILSGDYLYKQNEDSNYIYIIISGKFEIYSLVNLNWIENFYEYIINSQSNLVYFLRKNCPLKETELIEIYDKAKALAMNSPFPNDALRIAKIITSFQKKENLVDLYSGKADGVNLFKVNIRILEGRDVLGIEEALEMKKRFCFVKCISSYGEVNKIKLIDFFRLINYNPESISKESLMEFIAEKKNIFYRQLKKGVTHRQMRIEEELKEKCQMNESETIKDKDKDKEKENDKESDKLNDSELENIKESLRPYRTRNNKTIFSLQSTMSENISSNKVFRKSLTSSKIGNFMQKNIQKSNKEIKPLKYFNIRRQITISKGEQNNPNEPIKPNNKFILLYKKDENKIEESTSVNTNKIPLTCTSMLNIQDKDKAVNMKSISSFNNPKSTINLHKMKKSVKGEKSPKSQFLIFNKNSNELPQLYSLNSRKNKKIFLSPPHYAKRLENSYEALTTEIFKLTGASKIVPKKEILFNVVKDDDENALVIESYKKDNTSIIRHKKSEASENISEFYKSTSSGTHSNSVNIKMKKNRSYRNPSKLIEISMKNFKSLRRKRNEFNFNLY